MSKLNGEEFIDLVKRSKLVEADRLEEALSKLEPTPGESGVVGAKLVEAGLLTEWQCERLLAGRYKGFMLGKYKLLGHLGTGGMSSVFLAEHLLMRHRVAIKVLPHNLVRQSSYLERFHQEARATALLAHPNIVRAFDVDSEGDTHYLVMEYVEGKDVKAIVDGDGPLPYREAVEYMRQAADGLAYAHGKGLVHRDIKPANLLVDSTGTIKILDLGLARFSDESLASLTVDYDENMIGTVDYLAPEQALDSHNVDARADIYSLGCTLYFMLTGKPPFGEGTIPQRLMKHQKEEPSSIRRHRPDVPEELLSICGRMMAKVPATRFQTAAEVSEMLGAWLNGEPVGHGGIGKLRQQAPRQQAPRSKQSSPVTSDDDLLTLAPLDDEPPKPPGGVAGRNGDKKSNVPAPPPVHNKLPKVYKVSANDHNAPPVAAGLRTAERLPPRPPSPDDLAKPPSPDEFAKPPASDDLDDLLTDAPGGEQMAAGADWGAGNPLMVQRESNESIWRLMAMGSILGVSFLLIVAVIWGILSVILH